MHHKFSAASIQTPTLPDNDPSSMGGVKVKHQCWCGGRLKESVHPLYGQCVDCGTQVLRRSLTEAELQTFYGYQRYWHDHQTKVSGYPAIEQRAKSDFSDRIPAWHRLMTTRNLKPRRLLEFGCAHGGFLHYCAQHGCETVVGVEVDEATCEFARSNFGLPYVFSGLFPDVELPFDQFDVVCGFDVVEHFLDPVRAISHVKQLLGRDGICIFQTPCYRGEAGDWQQFRPQEHTFLYTQQGIRRLFDRCGLEVLEILPGYFPDDMFVIGGVQQPAAKAIARAAALTTPAATDRCWCGGSLVPSVHELYGRCEECGTQVLRRRLPPSELKEFYTFDQYRHAHQTEDLSCPPIEQRAEDDLKGRIPVWHKLLMRLKPDTQTLLEIGCAHGGFLHYCRKRGMPEVVGVEADESTCEFARTRFGLPHVYSGLFPAVELPSKQFDAITGFDVLEHLLDPVGALKKVARLLADDGVFLFQLQCYRGEGRDWKMFCQINHVFLYNEQSVRRLFTVAGLEIDRILPGHFPEDKFVLGRKQRPVRRLLWVRTDAIGDAVLASSLLEPIRQRHPHATLAVLCQQHVAELFTACPLVDFIICYDRRKMDDTTERGQIVKEISEFNPDMILNSVRSRDRFSNELTQAFCPARHIAIEGDLDNISAADRESANSGYEQIIASTDAHKPELARHADFLRGLGIESGRLQPTVWTTAADEAMAEAFFREQGFDPRKTMAVFPGAQQAMRIYRGYAEALSQLKEFNFLIFGDASQRHLADSLKPQLPGRAFNLCGRSTLRETIALLRRCRLYVGAESAGAHIACAVGVPNVVLLGGGHFGRFMPYSPLTTAVAFPLSCFGCNWHCKHNYAHCVLGLDPAVVAEALSATLDCSSAKPRVFVQAGTDNLSQIQQTLAKFTALDALEIIPVTTERPMESALPSLQYGHGVHKEEPGFRWLDTDAELQLSVPAGGWPCKMTFQLQASQLAHYGDRPVRTKVQVNGEREREIVFEGDHQCEEVELNFHPNAEPHFIHLHSNQSFSGCGDDRRLTVRLQKLSLMQKTDDWRANHIMKDNSHANGSNGFSHPAANRFLNGQKGSTRLQPARTNESDSYHWLLDAAGGSRASKRFTHGSAALRELIERKEFPG